MRAIAVPARKWPQPDATDVHDAVNLVGCFHENLLALQRSGVCGDDLINHPISLASVSKLNNLCRMSLDREMAVLGARERRKRSHDAQASLRPFSTAAVGERLHV